MYRCQPPFKCGPMCNTCVQLNDCVTEKVISDESYCIIHEGVEMIAPECYHDNSRFCVCLKSSLQTTNEKCMCISGDFTSETVVEKGDLCGYNYFMHNGEVVRKCTEEVSEKCNCGGIICKSSQCVNEKCVCNKNEDCLAHDFYFSRCYFGVCSYYVEHCMEGFANSQRKLLVCILCQNSYFPITNGLACVECHEAIEHCISCQVNILDTFCQECQPGYMVFLGYCVPCDEGCLECTETSICEPDQCMKGYFEDENSVCRKCNELVTGCTECIMQIVPTCLSINGNPIMDPSLCKGTTYPEQIEREYVCVECQYPCRTCINAYDCIEMQGYFIDSYGYLERCLSGCIQCTNAYNCEKCLPHFAIQTAMQRNSCIPCSSIMPGCTKCSMEECFEIDHNRIMLASQCPYGYLFINYSCRYSGKSCHYHCGLNCDSCLVEGDCKVGQYCVFENGIKSLVYPLCEHNAYKMIEITCYCTYLDEVEIASTNCICDPGIYIEKGKTLWPCYGSGEYCVTEGIACKKSDSEGKCSCSSNADCFSNQRCVSKECVYALPNCLDTVLIDNELSCRECETTHSLVNGKCLNCQLDLFYTCTACSSTQECTKFEICPIGFYVAKDKCVRCERPCETCAEKTCLSCVKGYYLDGFNCIACSTLPFKSCDECTYDGVIKTCTAGLANEEDNCIGKGIFFDKATEQCKTCFDNCIECDSEYECQECAEDYWLDDYFEDACYSDCPDQCLECHDDICQQCDSQSFNIGGQCYPCGSLMLNCLTCDESVCYSLESGFITADSCSPNFYFYEGACRECPLGCTSCVYNEKIICASCFNSFYPSMSICKPCSDVYNGCKSCIELINQPMCLDSSGVCPPSTIEYYSEMMGLRGCVSCGGACVNCTVVGEAVRCLECIAGFYLQNGVCHDCDALYKGCSLCNARECFEVMGFAVRNCPLDFQFDEETRSCFSCRKLFYSCVSCEGDSTCIEYESTYGVVGFKEGECPNGFVNQNSACVKCLENCQLCINTFSCSKCKPYYYIAGASCKSCAIHYAECSECNESACFANQLLAPSAPEHCPASKDYFYNPDLDGLPACQADVKCPIGEVSFDTCSCIYFEDTYPGKICIERPAGLMSIRICEYGMMNIGSICACINTSTKDVYLLEQGHFCDEEGNALLTTCQLGSYTYKSCLCSGEECLNSYCIRDLYSKRPMCKLPCPAMSNSGDCFCGNFYIEQNIICLEAGISQCEENAIIKYNCVCNVEKAVSALQIRPDCGMRQNQFCRSQICYNREDFSETCEEDHDCQTTVEMCVDGHCRTPCYEMGQSNCICGEFYIEQGKQCNTNGGVICSNIDGTAEVQYDCTCAPSLIGNVCKQGSYCYKQQCSSRGSVQLYSPCETTPQCALPSAKCALGGCVPPCSGNSVERCYCGDIYIEYGFEGICVGDRLLRDCAEAGAPGAGETRECACGGVLCADHCQRVGDLARCVRCDLGRFRLDGFRCVRRRSIAGIAIGAGACALLAAAAAVIAIFYGISIRRGEKAAAGGGNGADGQIGRPGAQRPPAG